MFARSMTLRGTLAAVAAAAVTAVSAPASAVTLASDNFDGYAYALSTQAFGPWLTSSAPGAVGGPNGGVDIIGPGFYDPYPGNGHYLDLSGVEGPTFLYTTVSGDPAATAYAGYVGSWTATVSFDLGQNPGGAAGIPVDVYLDTVNIGTVASTTALTPHTLSYTFTLGSALTTGLTGKLGFFTQTSTLAGNAGQGPILDNVTLTLAPVPEPSTVAMLLAGTAALGFLARRRRQGD